MTITNDKEPQYPPPANADNLYEQPLPPPHMNSNHREEPPFTPLPPPFHELRSYKEILICLTHLFHHLRLNHHNASCPGCDDESLLTLNPNANVYSEQPPDNFDSDMAVYYRLPPPLQPVYHGGHHSLPQNPTNYLDNKPTFRVYTKAKTDYSLTIRNGKVILAPTNSSDLHQHWIKDEKFGSSIKDEKGNPAFALVNKATGEAMKFSIGVTYPVQLKKYNPNEVDMTVLWSESNDLGDGYRSFRTVTNIHLNLDACKGVKEHGGVQDGTEIILWEWNDGENQKWIIFPYCKSFAQTYPQ